MGIVYKNTMKFSLSTLTNDQLMRYGTYASVGVASLIVLIKIVAVGATGSLSILSSLVDSALDILASLINLVALHYALQPADEDHRFGHGKAEDIAAFAQAAFITGSALFIFSEAIQRIVMKQTIESEGIGIIVMIISMVLTAGLVVFQRYIMHRTSSRVIEADSLHYLTDLAVNAAVIVSLLLSKAWNATWIDPLIALLIAVYICRSAWQVGIRAFNNLMDRELEEDQRDKIKMIVLSHPEIHGMHDLRTRYSGTKIIIQFHLELYGTMSLNDAHRISEEVEESICKEFPGAEITIHQDPLESTDDALARERVLAVR